MPEIAVPEADFDHLWKGIADQWPSYLSYATSILTSAASGSCTTPSSGACVSLTHVARLNLLLLRRSFPPFPTELVAEAINSSSSAERAAVLFYRARCW